MGQVKTSSSIVVVAGIAAIALAVTGYLNLSERLQQAEDANRALEKRLGTAEAGLQDLDPVRRLISQGPARLDIKNAYQAIQATGKPDARGGKTDSPRSWCPATENGGSEWLELVYESPVETKLIRLHCNYAPSAMIRVTTTGEDGAETEIWSGELPTAEVRLDAPRSLQRIKLHFDTSKVPGWNEVDAVALVTPDGTEHWAAEARASSEWKQQIR